ncbi:MAG: acsA1 [Polyangiaceae bacterium]|nr:acsA1 [Polyangiaceae bacterium]
MIDLGRAAAEGELLWEPSAERVASSRLSHFMGWLSGEVSEPFQDYAALWQWSVDNVQPFWRRVAEYFEVRLGGETEGQSEPTLVGAMPEAHWFPHATVSYSERLLRLVWVCAARA